MEEVSIKTKKYCITMETHIFNTAEAQKGNDKLPEGDEMLPSK